MKTTEILDTLAQILDGSALPGYLEQFENVQFDDHAKTASLSFEYDGRTYRISSEDIQDVNICRRCESELDERGFCGDATCPYSDHQQACRWLEEELKPKTNPQWQSECVCGRKGIDE